MTPDEFAASLDVVVDAMTAADDGDWSAPAGSLEWTCRHTLDHTVDCVFSYAFQLAARADRGFLPFGQLHALPTAAAGDLVAGLRAVGEIFLGGSLMPPPGLCAAVMRSPTLWMFDRSEVSGLDPWTDLLAGSGRRP